MRIEGNGSKQMFAGLLVAVRPHERVARPAQIVDVGSSVVLFVRRFRPSLKEAGRLAVQPGEVGFVAMETEKVCGAV